MSLLLPSQPLELYSIRAVRMTFTKKEKDSPMSNWKERESDTSTGVVEEVDFVALLVDGLLEVFELPRNRVDDIGLGIHLK